MIKDLTNKKFGYWTVINRAKAPYTKKTSTPAFWLCRCKCNNKKVVRGDILRRGESKSCGCWDEFDNGFNRAMKNKTRKNPNTGCIEWMGRRDQDGYARYGEKSKSVTRLLMKEKFGNLTQDKVVCHTCDNPGCVSIEHLWIGTPKENNDDKVEKGRTPIGSNHHKSKLKETDVDHIRILAKEGVFQSIIAEEYGVTQSTISVIILNKGWKHI